MVPDSYGGAFAGIVMFLFSCNIDVIFVSDSIIFDLVLEERNEMETILIHNHLGTLCDNFLTE